MFEIPLIMSTSRTRFSKSTCEPGLSSSLSLIFLLLGGAVVILGELGVLGGEEHPTPEVGLRKKREKNHLQNY